MAKKRRQTERNAKPGGQSSSAISQFPTPQKDPAFYDSFLKTYNVPELVTGPIPVGEREIARAVLDTSRTRKPTTDAPGAAPSKENPQESEVAHRE